MADMNYDRILQSFYNFNMVVEKSIFKKTVFLDEEVEQQYKLETSNTSKKNKMYIDAFIVFCYIAITFYIYINKYKMIFAYLGLGCLGICVFLMAYSYYKRSLRFNEVINHVMVFLLSIFLNFKIIYIACYLITQEDDHDSEIIRTLTYDFISKNILCLMVLDTRMTVIVALYLLNVAAVIVTEIKSNSAHHYYLDNLVGLIVTVFCLYFKKLWETENRSNFAGKYRFENYYNYTRDFIIGLNGNYINISNDSSICCEPSMRISQREKFIKRVTSKGKSLLRNVEMKQIDETNKINEVNSFMAINNLQLEEDDLSKLSVDVLSLFTLYKNEGNLPGNSNNTEFKLTDKLNVLMSEPSTSNFRNIGIYKLKSLSGIKYFEIHFRKFSIKKINSINDLMIYDVTELIESKQQIVEDGIIKQKFLAKIVHEFKTPLNSIIGLIGSIEDSFKTQNTDANKPTKKHLETVRNLSNYVILLISDIIHFSSIKSLEDIQVNLEDINLREITNFGFDILNSLLRCNKAKCDAIQSVYEFEQKIEAYQIKADDKRLKQIILNFVSNAVKFTKSGRIKLKCKINSEKEYVILSISDTGVGIPEEEKDKLFNDFKMIKNDSIDNVMGSGLGLSICKSLASSMNMKISTSSIYGQGSEFSLAIPIIPKPLPKSSLTKLISIRNKVNNEEQKEVHLQESEELKENNLNRTEQSYRSGLNERNVVLIHELKPEINENLIIDSNRSDLKTVRLGFDGYINPKINFLTYKLDNEINDQIRINSTGIPNSYFSTEIPNNYFSTGSPRAEVNLGANLALKKKGKILIVDDNTFINEATKNVLMKVLKEAGSDMEIILGSDGSDIIHLLIKDQSEGNEIKCILTDENMEYINGTVAIKIIRNLEKLQKVKFVNIISVTANEESSITSEIIRAGAQLVVNKPFSKTVLAKVLKEFNII